MLTSKNGIPRSASESHMSDFVMRGTSPNEPRDESKERLERTPPDPFHKTSPKVNNIQSNTPKKGTTGKVVRDCKPLFVVLMKILAYLTDESTSNFGLSLVFLTTHANLAR